VRVIAGEWRGRRIQPPPGRTTRPTTDRVREAWMSTVAAELDGARVLDLFAGSGALGLEALSRGAAHATFVETAAPALRVLRSNIEALGAAGRATVFRSDALRYAAALAPGSFDVAFADPPYGEGFALRLAEVFVARPFAAVLCVEHHRDDALPTVLPDHRSRRYGDTVLTYILAPS
jgi:16S rRNA (guanine966-N2)-methyltransferase